MATFYFCTLSTFQSLYFSLFTWVKNLLFLCNFSEIDRTGLTTFYESVLQAWQGFRVTRDPAEIHGMWLFEEPLLLYIFFYRLIKSQVLSSASLRSALREAGCAKLGQLRSMTRTSVTELGQLANIRSSRLMARILKEVVSSLSERQKSVIQNNTNS